MDENCLAKAAIAAAGGAGIGFVMALFLNAVEFRQLDTVGGFRQTTREALKVDLKRMKGMSRNFAVFGSLFCIFECQLEKLRYKDDSWNSFWGGALTSVVLGANVMGPRGLFFSGLGGGLFGMVMYKLNIMGH